ncbi:MAG: hypothetical protein NVS3B26_28480 [Mycobacteriales bacterium]
MSAESNKQAVSAGYEGFSRGDLDPVFALIADDVVWTNHATQSPLAGEYRGVAGVQEFFTKLDALAEITKFDMHTIIAEGDHLVALGYSALTVKATGNAGEGPLVHVFRFTDGKVSTFDEYEHVEPGLWD